MIPQEQLTAIAEACGWRDIKPNPFAPNPPLCGLNNDQGKTEAANCGSPWGIPDYLNDLNAMHEAEKSLTDGVYLGQYIHALDDIQKRDGNIARAVSATASQRAEAFLRTIGKWKD